jgi:hypothetical protein
MRGKKLFVHIGLQKTGTSYLQSIFWQNKKELRAQGLDMVPGSLRETFWLMLDVRDRFEPEFDPPRAGRSVQRLPRQLERAPGSRALITEESFAPSTDEQIERLLAACGDREVHVVLTVRDLARQIPSSWQQHLQSGGEETLATYVQQLRDTEGADDADGPHGAWRQKDGAAVLARWSRHVPPDRIHVVTVPPSGSPPGELLGRFCRVLDVDPDRLGEARTRPNESLSAVAAEVLRRVNQGVPPPLRRRDIYGAIGKRYFAIQVLASQRGPAIRLPREHREWVGSVAERQVAYLRDAGVDIVGDLDDLVPDDTSFAPEDTLSTDAELLEVATTALSTMLSDQIERKREEKAERQAEPQPVHAPPPAPPSLPRRAAQRVLRTVAGR